MGKRSKAVKARKSAADMLVSVVTPTHERAALLLSRSIPSVLAQTHTRFEMIVSGDGATQEVKDAMATVTDPRVRFIDGPRHQYPDHPLDAWHVSGSAATNRGMDAARGAFTCLLGDDDAYAPTFIEELLNAIVEQGTTAAYCASMIHKPNGAISYLGLWYPPQFAHQAGGEFMWRRNDLRYNPECWREGKPNDWDFITRMTQAGATFAHVRKPLYHYFPSKHVPLGAPHM